MIKIMLNGKEEILDSDTTISKLLEDKKIRKEVVTVELNGKIINREEYDSAILKNTDALEFVYFMGGGFNG